MHARNGTLYVWYIVIYSVFICNRVNSCSIVIYNIIKYIKHLKDFKTPRLLSMFGRNSNRDASFPLRVLKTHFWEENSSS